MEGGETGVLGFDWGPGRGGWLAGVGGAWRMTRRQPGSGAAKMHVRRPVGRARQGWRREAPWEVALWRLGRWNYGEGGGGGVRLWRL